MARVLVLHGPNLNRLGTREPDVYGSVTLAALDADLRGLGEALGLDVECQQHNSEGALIDAIHSAEPLDSAESAEGFAAIVLNPAAYTHTSVAIADAIRAISVPVLEVHLSNLFARDPLRHVSLTASACVGVITGFGAQSYSLALHHVAARLQGDSD
jgi:3-dehydroquinate dehydratase-2